MERLVATIALLLMAPALASAQSTDHLHRGEGYVFIGEGLNSEGGANFGVTHVGGGGEVLLLKELGVESELGVMGTPSYSVGLFSIDSSYRLLPSSSKSQVVPFVDAGYTRAFGNRGFPPSNNLFNFGGGIHYWPFKRVGLRLDFRDYVDHAPYVDYGRVETHHFPALRIGLAVR
jgi:hypothetical protein